MSSSTPSSSYLGSVVMRKGESFNEQKARRNEIRRNRASVFIRKSDGARRRVVARSLCYGLTKDVMRTVHNFCGLEVCYLNREEAIRAGRKGTNEICSKQFGNFRYQWTFISCTNGGSSTGRDTVNGTRRNMECNNGDGEVECVEEIFINSDGEEKVPDSRTIFRRNRTSRNDNDEECRLAGMGKRSRKEGTVRRI